MNTLDDLQAAQGAWSAATFPLQTPASILAHLAEEVVELQESLEPEEAADCLLLLLGLAAVRGFSLWEAATSKHAVNKARRWTAPDPNGVVHHDPNGGDG